MPIIFTRRSSLAVALLALAGVAHAGSVPHLSTNISLIIDDGQGNSWDLSSELAAMVTADKATGDVYLTQPGSVISDADGRWTPNATLTLADGTQVSGLQWNSLMRTDGTVGSTASSDNPWAQTLLITRLQGQADPEMSYGFYIKNNGAGTASYTVAYGETIAPTITGAYTLTADIGGSLTTTTNNSVTVAPTFGSVIQRVLLSTDGGLTYVNGGVDVGPGMTANTLGTTNYPTDSASTSGVAPAGGYNYWTFETKFTLTGGKDIFVASGSTVITPVPELSSPLMAVAGLGLMGLVVSRRRAA